LFFLLTKGVGSAINSEPYEMKFTDSYGNIVICFVDRPEVMSTFFMTSNSIDTHNQLHQDLLQLEKKWLTKNPYFRLATTLLGINVTDTFLLANHHKIIDRGVGSIEEKNKHPTIFWNSIFPAAK
jgi:hypothetical protein